MKTQSDFLSLSEEHRARLTDRLLNKGFELIFDGIYVFDSEATQGCKLSYLGCKFYSPVGRFDGNSLVLPRQGMPSLEGLRKLLLTEYEATRPC